MLIVAISGCASINPVGPPLKSDKAEIKAHIDPRLPTLEQKWASPAESPNSEFGLATPAHGSLAVALLFGPLGIFANQAHVQSLNEAKAAGRTSYSSLNLADMLHESDSSLQISIDSIVGEYYLLPTGRIQFLDNGHYLIACVLNVEYLAADKSLWKMRYDVNSETVFVTGQPTEAEDVVAAIRHCLIRAKDLFVSHVSSKLGATVQKKIELPGLTIKIPVYTDMLPEHLINNPGVVVQEMRQSIAKIVD